MSSHRARAFFREVARSLPYIMNTYKMTEITTLQQLRGAIASEFRRHGSIRDPKVVEMLVYQGRENLEQTLLQHRQRHHLVTKYVSSPSREAAAQRLGHEGPATFLSDFYEKA